MANEQNLIRNEDRTPEQRRENARKAGKASGAKRHRKKLLREIAEAVGAAQAPEEVKLKMQKLGLATTDDITLDEALMMAQYGRALSGNVSSANFIAEMKGEKIQRIEQVNIDDRSMTRLNEDFGFDNKESEDTTNG